MGKVITSTTGDKIIVDDEDYSVLSRFNWKTYNTKNRVPSTSVGNDKTYFVSIHRFLFRHRSFGDYYHINGDSLDCRKENIKFRPYGYSVQHSVRHMQNKISKYRGVGFNKKRGTYYAKIMQNGKSYFLGSYINEKDAAIAYDAKAVDLYGRNALTNFATSTLNGDEES